MNNQLSIHADNKINNMIQTGDSLDDSLEVLDNSKFQSDRLEDAESGPAIYKELVVRFSKSKDTGFSS